jgi:hypothetical protein
MQVPPVNVVELRQKIDLAFRGNLRIDQRDELFVIIIATLAAHFETDSVDRKAAEQFDHANTPNV